MASLLDPEIWFPDVWQTRWDLINFDREAEEEAQEKRELEEAIRACPGDGACHGCLQWCRFCGDVGEVCDVREWPQRCDCHERYPAKPEPDPNQLLLFEDEVRPASGHN